ncbi:MAG: ribonuclease Z [Desulfobacterales bacterium]
MRPSFHPRLINGPFDDPGLFVPFIFSKRAFIFDIGDLHAISPRDILKISHAFVTHTHMDHFIGFDTLLRLMLGREKVIHLYGPEGFIRNVEGKLAGYTWNLVENYETNLILHAHEIFPDHMVSQTYACSDRFLPTAESSTHPFSGVLLQEPAISVSAILLDHDIPCLGFSMAERFHINIKKEAVSALGLEIGPWLNRFKEAVYRHGLSGHPFRVDTGEHEDQGQCFTIKELADKIAVITPGQKILYIADTADTESNTQKIITFAEGADHLFIEACFLEADRHAALKKRHLTARKAGFIAGKAGVKQFTIFHFSPRYIGMEKTLYEEAFAAYEAIHD